MSWRETSSHQEKFRYLSTPPYSYRVTEYNILNTKEFKGKRSTIITIK